MMMTMTTMTLTITTVNDDVDDEYDDDECDDNEVVRGWMGEKSFFDMRKDIFFPLVDSRLRG